MLSLRRFNAIIGKRRPLLAALTSTGRKGNQWGYYRNKTADDQKGTESKGSVQPVSVLRLDALGAAALQKASDRPLSRVIINLRLVSA